MAFPFTPLIEPASSVSTNPPPAPFDAGMAYLMGQCCSLTYTQLEKGSISLADFSSLVLSGSLKGATISASNLTTFTISEPIASGATSADVGEFVDVQSGFGVQFTITPASGSAGTITVIALRGTRTFAEFMDDAEAFPVPFAGFTVTLSDHVGSMHAGFYADYTLGTYGQKVSSDQALSKNVSERAKGSLAAQVGAYVTALKSVPIYVTGHSLGAALATICGLDIAYNFGASASQLSVYTLACPRVAAGLSNIPTLDDELGFVTNYQALVPNTYQIVNAADIVPILPPASTAIGPETLTAMQVSDAWTAPGTGGSATATVSGDAVSAIKVDHGGSGYSRTNPPAIVLTGGGGSGASAVSAIGLLGGLDITLVNGGTGYTSAPQVQIVSSGSLAKNIVTFCAQQGDVGSNHACAATYVPYLEALANGFS